MARDIKTGVVPGEILTKIGFQRSSSFGALGPGTYEQSAIATGLLPQAGFIWSLEAVEFNFDVVPTVNGAGSMAMEVVLTRSSKAAMPAMNDLDVIARARVAIATTAAGVAVLALDMPLSLQFEGDAIIAGPQVYIGVQLGNCTLAAGSSYSALISYVPKAKAKERILEVLYG